MERHANNNKGKAILPGQVPSLPASNDEPQNGERRTDQGTDPDKRLTRVSDILYECIPDGTFCEHRLSFGYRSYCAWILNHRSLGPDRQPPCLAAAKVCGYTN